MSRHFDFHEEINASTAIPKAEAWYSTFWRPTLLELPSESYVPQRYKEMFDGTWMTKACDCSKEKKRRRALLKEYEDVLSQYKGNIYNELWLRDNQMTASLMHNFMLRAINRFYDKAYDFMYKSWLFPWIKDEPLQKVVFAERLDLYTIDFYRSVQECNSRIFTNSVEISLQFAAPALALAGLIYGFKTGYFLDQLGLAIIDGVLMRK